MALRRLPVRVRPVPLVTRVTLTPHSRSASNADEDYIRNYNDPKVATGRATDLAMA